MQIRKEQPIGKFLQTDIPRAMHMKYGQPFSHNIDGNLGPIYIRVKPTGFLLNSEVIGDILNRGDIVTVNLTKNTLYYMKGDTPVVLRNAYLVTEDES